MQLSAALGRLSLTPRRSAGLSSTAAVRGAPLAPAARGPAASRAVPLAAFAKQNSVQRVRLAEKARLVNKARKSAVATRMKKVFKAASTLESESDVAPLERLISEAAQEIDKAASKGVLHKNTAARRKSRLAAAKRDALVRVGLYTPA